MINNRSYQLGVEPSVIRELFMWGLDRKAEIGEDKVFDYSIGNPSVPAPPEVKASVLKHMDDDPVALHAYSVAAGIASIRERVAEHITKTFNFKASAKNIYLTAGASGALAATFGAICNEGDEVIIPAPYFPEYAMGIGTAGASILPVQCLDDTFQLDLNAISASINEKTAAIVINSPNNPTGAVYPREDLEKLADILLLKEKEFGIEIYLIADEPYREITYGAEVAWLPEIYSRTIVCYSFSKTLSLPGERIGYLYVSDTMPDCDVVFDAVSGSARSLGYVCAPVLFQHVMADCIDVSPNVKPYAENRDLLCAMLDELGFEYVQPKGAFYLWVKALEPSAKAFSDEAKNLDLLIVPSESFGSKGWVRLSYCIAEETILNSRPAFEKLMKHYSEK